MFETIVHMLFSRSIIEERTQDPKVEVDEARRILRKLCILETLLLLIYGLLFRLKDF